MLVISLAFPSFSPSHHLSNLLDTDKMADAIAHLQAGRTRTEWLSQLNTEYVPKRQFRRSSIICTIG